jgi:hypothetical protein
LVMASVRQFLASPQKEQDSARATVFPVEEGY